MPKRVRQLKKRLMLETNSRTTLFYKMKNSVEDKDKLAEKIADDAKSNIKDALTDSQDWLNAN